MISKDQAAELHKLVESMTQIHAWQGVLLASANNLLGPAASSRSAAKTARKAKAPAKPKRGKRPTSRSTETTTPTPRA